MKKAYVVLIIIIILLSLLTACANDEGVRPDTSLQQQSLPTPSPTVQPDTSSPQQSQLQATTAITPIPAVSAAIIPETTPVIWPEEYSAILKDYRTIAKCIFQDFNTFAEINASDDYDVYDVWQEQNIPVLRKVGKFYWELGYGLHDDKYAYGYALKDLNGDGSDELIILLKGYTVLAIYLIVDGKPKQVDIFWERHNCHAMDKSGLLYIYNSENAGDWLYTIERLSDDGSELLTVEQYGLKSWDSDTGEWYPESRYYKVTDGKSYSEREIITEAEFREFKEKHPAFADWNMTAETAESAGIIFIPILD